MDQTSENDFTVQSYILYKFDKLTSVQKQEISNILLEYIKTKNMNLLKKLMIRLLIWKRWNKKYKQNSWLK